ncbi:transcription termination/antitermination protein NusG [Desulfurobacterium atlanticum]|uniref:Transcriptional antiterminator RfaH n=1 Tax=Desulfurobacterium atlanticum TaxID=240169 RepID=A0A238XLB5_9BACT|nr:transcription termination/antitermination NusG family protein [Desulfurobacterium atlanticum]SNR59727.1 transcriptional antiterminator RfaH [Desulfurobacterium atlanticum]
MEDILYEKKWYIVALKPRKEKVVFAQLDRIGVEYFYPVAKIKKGKLLKEEPLFPGYMFAKFSIAENFNNVRFARGVRDIVRFGKNIPFVDDGFIEVLKEKVGDVIEFGKPAVSEGELVRIKEGPFRGLIGQILSVKRGDERVVLLLKSASLSSKVELPVSFVEKIS